MVLTKSFLALKTVRFLNKNKLNNFQPSRNSGHHCNYRCPPPDPPKKTVWLAELIGGFAWWWVLWHLWTEPGHVFGEFPYPNPREWTDEELGIPSLG